MTARTGSYLSRFAASTFFFITPIAFAQSSAQDPETNVLDVITVTAQKREQSAQDVPISVNVTSGEVLQKRGFQSVSSLSDFVPNLSITEGLQGQNLYMRGVGSSGSNIALEQSVSIFIDGIYQGRSRQSMTQFLDIEAVEVLRGPQPTYFGQNSIAGALNIRTKRAGDTWDGFAQLEAGTRSLVAFEAAAGGPISENWGIRVAGKYNQEDGHLDNIATGGTSGDSEGYAGRITLDGDVSDSLSVALKYETASVETSGFRLQTAFCDDDTVPGNAVDPNIPCQAAISQGIGEFRINSNLESGALPVNGLFNLFGIPAPFRDGSQFVDYNDDTGRVDSDAFTLDLSYVSEILEIEYTFGLNEYESFRRGDIDSTPYALLADLGEEEVSQTSHEIRLTSMNTNKLEWMVGAYYQDTDIDTDTNVRFAGFTAPLPLPTVLQGPFLTVHDEDNEWLSVFALVSYNITDTFAIDIGGRYTDVEKTAFSAESGTTWQTDASGILITGVDPFPDAFSFQRGETVEADDFNPSIGFRWNFLDDQMVYVKYAEAFKAGGFGFGGPTGINRDDDTYTYDVESVDSFEVGYKSTLLEGRAQLNVALFHSEYSGLQVPTFSDGSFFLQNAAGSTSQGLEIEAVLAATDNLILSLSGSVLDASYDSFEDAQCGDFELAAGVCDVNGARDRSGETLLFAPDYNIVLGANFDQPIKENLNFFVNVNAVLSGGYAADSFYNPRNEQDDFAKVDLRVGLLSESGNWEISLFARNLGDERTISAINDTVLNGTASTFFLSRGDSFGALFRYSY